MTDHLKHLSWRAGFGLSPDEWLTQQQWPLKKALDHLFENAAQASLLAPPPQMEELPEEAKDIPENKREELKERERKLVSQYNIQWLKRMADPAESALLEKMTLFWHGHFACQIRFSGLAVSYLNTLRQHGLGSFRDLLLGVSKEPAMIRFLNNQQNKKQKPNENFARELLELFTIGHGNYAEQDIKEAARAFTGWSSNLKGEFVFRQAWHDYDAKTFFGKTGPFDGADIIDMVLQKPETALFITKKIYRFFVNDTLDKTQVNLLAKQFYDSEYDIGQLMHTIFSSDWFYDKKNLGVHIKSPVELIAGLFRSFGATLSNEDSLLFLQRELGQLLFNPPNVAGWPSGKSWIDNSTLMLRLNLGGYLLNASEINQREKADFEATDRLKAPRRLEAQINWHPFRQWLGKIPQTEAVVLLTNYLLGVQSPLDGAVWNKILQSSDDSDPIEKTLTVLLSLPEYQVC